MGKQRKHRAGGQRALAVNPQGHTEDVADQQPVSQLEQRAKKKNTKI
ncbi:small, acid-soluble spore protein L [Salirhabdus sp. Marseille-P4669]|nr:small, acid-soluble spore protein L [Salirhabdus sp. Marseille-P4669]